MTSTHPRYAPLAAAALLTLGLVASGALAALGADEAASSEPLPTDAIEGVTWQLQEQAVDGALAGVPDDVVVTLILEDGGVGGNGGCNSYFGSYTLDGDAVTFGEIGSTLMACAPPAGDVEAAYFANLASVATWSSDGGSLTMAGADGDPVLIFRPASMEPIPADGVQGITWQLSEQAVDGGLTAVPEDVLVTLVLEAGNAGGNGGCNTYFASYEIDGAAISFGPIGSTMMACEGPSGETEAAYFANLALVASWSSDGGSLSLSDADGNVLLVFEPAPCSGSWAAGWPRASTTATRPS